MQRRCWYLEMADPKKRLIRSDRGLSDLEIISRSQPLSDPVGSRPELERVAIGLLERLMPAPQAGLCKNRAADTCSAVLEPLQIAEGAYLPQGVAGTSRWDNGGWRRYILEVSEPSRFHGTSPLITPAGNGRADGRKMMGNGVKPVTLQ